MIWAFRLLGVTLGIVALVETVEWMSAAAAVMTNAASLTGGTH